MKNTRQSATSSVRFERLDKISVADARAIGELVRLLDPDAHFSAASLRRSMKTRTTTLCVLRDGSRIVAAAAAVRFATPTGCHCRIEDVVVDGTHRGLGLGRRIMEGTLAVLRREGVSRVELTSRPSRIAANALYQTLGFQRRETNVYVWQP